MKTELVSADREKMKQLIKHAIKRSRRSEIAEDIKDEVRHDTDELKTALSELNSKMDELITIRKSHDHRVLELEQKIRERVSDNYIEIIKVEQHLAELEEHFKTIKKKRYDPTIIEEIRNKINQLRGRVNEKKTRMMMEHITTAKPIPRPRIIMPPPESLKPMIRHEMQHFRPQHSSPLQPMPPAPPAPPIPPITPHFIRREPKQNRFWNFIERLYGG
jgi:DNA repair exonuclease SbcCD ATPase subunit